MGARTDFTLKIMAALLGWMKAKGNDRIHRMKKASRLADVIPALVGRSSQGLSVSSENHLQLMEIRPTIWNVGPLVTKNAA